MKASITPMKGGGRINIDLSMDDLKGGAGSGNFGHQGRPGHVGGAGSGGSAGGLNEASIRIAEKYKDQQAWHGPISEMMEVNGLTLEDYKKANEVLYSHNIASGDLSDKALTDLWNSNESEGKALRLMSDWNEWQIENTNDRRREDLSGVIGRMEKLRSSHSWESIKQNYVDAEYFDGFDGYIKHLENKQRGEKHFYRKGPLDKKAVSVTDDPRGATSGSSRFKPDRILSYKEMKDSGYRLLAGSRGMVGVTSAAEREFIWLKVKE